MDKQSALPNSMLPIIIVLLITILNISESFITSTEVTIGKLGVAIGKLDESKWSRRKFYSFQGIPFAEPPIGDLRYRPPVKINSWNDPKIDATNFRNICPQTKLPGYDVEGYDEDCLHLNIYVPAGSRKLLPVMIWIHGGSFISGHAQRYKPHYFMESDVILVVPQFRLGTLGLLCLETEEIPGNVQFLDQIMAMEWVRDNIECLGGDSNDVTLFGQSSGGYSVNLHLLSPLSRGLFNRTIIQSNAIYMIPTQVDKNPVKSATDFANDLGCNIESSQTVTECFKKLPAKSILEGYAKYKAKNLEKGIDVSGGDRVVIQTSGSVKFLPDEPSVLISEGKYQKLPMIGGATRQDGSLLASGLYDALSPTKYLTDSDFLNYELVPLALKLMGITDETRVFSKLLTDQYFPNGESGNFLNMVPGLTDIGSTLIFKAGVHRMLQENSRFQPTYLYSFDYEGSQTRFGYESSSKYPFRGGVAHSDDNIYQFPFPDKMTEEDTFVAKTFLQLWTNFAINGTPFADRIKSWPKMTTRNGPYLKIDSESSIGDNYLDEYTVTIREGLRSSSSSIFVCDICLVRVIKITTILFLALTFMNRT